MKELTIEEKAKRYDEAIKYAHYLINERCKEGTGGSFHRADLNKMFPELKESEDEKIKKWLINDIKTALHDGIYNGSSIHAAEKALAWLEKQGEQKPVEPQQDMLSQEKYAKAVDECIYGEQKPADKFEPKFKVGDWVVYNRNDHDSSREIIQVYDIRDGRYYFNDNIHFSWSVKECDEKSHLWTIQDAKDGDVLINDFHLIFIFKEIKNDMYISYCSIIDRGNDVIVNSMAKREVGDVNLVKCHPATKEQRDTLIKAMADAGYTFDFEKKELRKMEQNPINNQFTPEQASVLDKHIDKFTEQSPVWSKEDDAGFADVMWAIQKARTIAKDENDMGNLWCAERWLKSLKERYTWKPSDEQMEALESATENCAYSEYQDYLRELIDQLKKLKE